MTSYETVWDLCNLPQLRNLLYLITDEQNKRVATEVIDAFESKIIANLSNFRKAVIHGDFNDHNIIIDGSHQHSTPTNGETDPYTLSVIDFGDSHEGYYFMEVAIAIMYHMLDCISIDPLDVASYILAGFQKSFGLEPNEIDALRICVAARFVQSLILGRYSYSKDPGNEYLLMSAKRGWIVLHKLWETPEEELHKKWVVLIDNPEDKLWVNEMAECERFLYDIK